MIIHLEASWDDATLERFALIISQHSVHVALQLNWILQGAIEDYQPETAEGLPNPAYNPLFYTRCVKLLDKLERCVVYGTPRAHELQKMYETGKITQEEYEVLELADRTYNAAQIMESMVHFDNGESNVEEGLAGINACGGYLLYKRRVRRGALHRKRWKTRYFKVSNRMLHCYNHHPDKGGVLVRAMPLEGASVSSIEGKYPHMFEIVNQDYVYRVRASSEDDKEKWISFIGEEAESKSLLEHTFSPKNGKGDADSTVCSQMNQAQNVRYKFFLDERNFIRNLCGVAENLRFHERDERKKHAPGLMEELQIPECVYLPLCNSTDTWRRVDKTLAKETRVFNTNERCPTLMYFLSTRGEGKEKNIDNATFLFEHLQKYDDVDDVKLEPLVEEREEANNISFEVDLSGVGNGALVKGTVKEVSTSENVSISVWHKDELSRSKRFSVKDIQTLPKNIAKAIDNKIALRKKSKLDFATLPVQSVKIVSPPQFVQEEDVKSLDEDPEIDQESLNRAKEVVCGGETWASKSERFLKQTVGEESGVQNDTVFEIQSVIAKSNDDLRQEVFVMQMIHYYKSVFVKEGLPIWLFTYRILSTSKTTGLIEVINNATSIDGLKKSEGFPSKGGLREYFIQTYGKDTSSFRAAQRNFMLSLVGYALVSFLLGLKDRHNGNIMIDTKGHLIFIDFGFAMGMAPGHEFSFEKAPFKLTAEYMDVMGGKNSQCFAEFKNLFVQGFEAARANAQVALGLVEIMMYKSNFPCFTGSRYGHGISLKRFEHRLMLDVPDSKIKKKALGLIE